MESPDISYIVSAYNRPLQLRTCLASIAAQTHQRFEVIVTDNAIDNGIAKAQKEMIAQFDKRFRYVRTTRKIEVSDCYYSAEYAVKNMASGTWYGFPCDDTYYMPEFGSRMLAAAYKNSWDFVYARSVVVGPEAAGGSGYRLWTQTVGHTVKTCFLIRASVFPGFGGKPDVPVPVAADYFFGTQMVENGISMGAVDEVLLVHN